MQTMATETPPLGQDLDDTHGFLTPQFFDNPYIFYQMLQDTDPIHWSTKTSSWLITRYTDVADGLRNSNFSSKRTSSHLQALPDEARAELEPLSGFYGMWLMYMEEPDHGRVRQLVNRPFSPDSVEQQVASIQEKAQSLLGNVSSPTQVDLLSEYALPLAVHTIGEMLGLPKDEHSLVLKWSHDLVGFLGAKGDIEKGRAAQKTLTELTTYLEPIVNKRPDQIQSDLLSTLVTAEQNGQISKAELLAVVANVLIDGHEPIANTIANGMFALLNHPDQIFLLRQRPDLMPSAVEEIIRYEPAFQYAARTAIKDTVLGDKNIAQGQRVQFMLGAANHDSRQFINPDILDIQRSPNQHGSFGFGIHYCPGARLGRRTVQIALESVLEKFPDIQIAEQPQWASSLGYRALTSLKIAV